MFVRYTVLIAIIFAGVGYFVIFLLMQPNAYDCLVATLRCKEYSPQSKANNKQQQQVQSVTSSALHESHTTTRNTVADGSYLHTERESAMFSMRHAEDEELWQLVRAEATGRGEGEIHSSL